MRKLLQPWEAYVQNNEFDSALVAYSNAEKLSEVNQIF